MKISNAKRQFYIDIVNIAVENGVIEQFGKVKKQTYYPVLGCVNFIFINEDEEKTVCKLTIKEIQEAMERICETESDEIDEDVEKNILYANKRNDASLLTDEDIGVIIQIASFGELE